MGQLDRTKNVSYDIALLGVDTGVSPGVFDQGAKSDFSVWDLDSIIKKPRQTKSIGKVRPESIYGSDSRVMKFRRSITKCQDNLEDALKIKDEIERESVMNLFTENILKLAEFVNINKNLKDILIYLQVAVMSQLKDIYDREKLLVLKDILANVRDNIFMDDETKRTYIKKIEDAGFESNEPFGDVSF